MPVIESVLHNGQPDTFYSVDGHALGGTPSLPPVVMTQYRYLNPGDDPKDQKFSGTIQKDEMAVVFYAAQQDDPGFQNWSSSGFSAPVTHGLAGTRMGYAFAKQLQNIKYCSTIQWWNPNTAFGGRQVAVLIVIRKDYVANFKLKDWTVSPTQDFFEEGRDTYFVGQSHFPGNIKPREWGIDVLTTGEDSVRTDASWSSIRVASLKELPGTGGDWPQAWAGFTVEPTKLNPNAPKLEIHEFGKSAAVMPFGYDTAKAAFTKRANKLVIGHRGISDSEGEHTVNAYTDAVARGVPVLEMSLGRSQDGVWFGCHDDNLARLGGPATKVKDMTFSQIEEIMYPLGKRPMRLDELLNVYGNSHVLLLDAKYELARVDEVLALIPDKHKPRIAWKNFGDSLWLFNKMKANNIVTYAYSYMTNINASWYQSMLDSENIDVLAIDWDSSAEIWQKCKATGKFVVGHIVHSQQQHDTAVASGADGIMTADVYRYPLLV